MSETQMPQAPGPQRGAEEPPAKPSVGKQLGSAAGDLAKGLLVKVGVAILGIAIAAGAYLLFVKEAGDKAPKVGECVVLTRSDDGSGHEAKSVDCGAADAVYKVTADTGACDEAEVEYTVSVRRRGSSTTAAKLCMALNVKKGDCIEFGSAMDPSTKVACAKDGGSDVGKVLLVKEGSTQEAECPKETVMALPNITRKTLICFGEDV